MIRLPVLTLCVSLLGVQAHAGPAFVLDGTGRTLKVKSHVGTVRGFSIEIPNDSKVSLCREEFKRGALTLLYTAHREVVNPSVLDPNATGVQPVPYRDRGFRINAPHSGFIVYNIRSAALPKADVEACAQKVEVQERNGQDAKDNVNLAEDEFEKATARATTLGEELKSRQQDADAYTGVSGSGAEIKALLNIVDKARTDYQDAAKDLALKRQALAEARKALDDSPAAIKKELGAPLERAIEILNSLRAGAIIKIGVVFVSDRQESVYFDFASRGPDSTLQLDPIGDYPVVTHEERVFAVIANVDASQHPYRFRLSATVTAGAAINTEPVRPTFDAAGEATALVTPKEPVASLAWRDVVLPVRDSVPPNGIAEVTIATEQPSAADAKKMETVTLVEKLKFPQYRARYRYNFTSGVFQSDLRAHDFVKVRIQDDDPATEKVNEARYRIEEIVGDKTIRPVFTLSYYVFPVDIQSRVGWRDWLPSPTLAFAFEKPQDNIYIGFSHEVWRNVQVFWGWHHGVVNELVTRNDISEDTDVTAPVTRTRRAAKEFAWGVSFNIATVAKVFK